MKTTIVYAEADVREQAKRGLIADAARANAWAAEAGWQKLQAAHRVAPRANCRNCGAPPEPICSYCGTRP